MDFRYVTCCFISSYTFHLKCALLFYPEFSFGPLTSTINFWKQNCFMISISYLFIYLHSEIIEMYIIKHSAKLRSCIIKSSNILMGKIIRGTYIVTVLNLYSHNCLRACNTVTIETPQTLLSIRQ